MDTQETKAIADTVDEAEAAALRMMPDGYEPIVIEVQSDGSPSSVSASARDEDTSIRLAQAKLPTSDPEPRVVDIRTEVTDKETRTFRSFQEDFSERMEKLDAEGKFGKMHVNAIRSEVKWQFLSLTRYLHSVELIGGYQTKISYERQAEVTVQSRPFKPPSETSTAFVNPFSVLGLRNDVTSVKTVAQRAGDITPLIEMQLNPASYLDDFDFYPLFSSGGTYSAKDVAAAKSQLISDIGRLNAARFWFSDLAPEERAELACAADFGQAMNAIDRASRLSPEEKTYSAALVSWYQCVAGELQTSGSRLTYAVPRWRKTLEEWCGLYHDGTIVACTTERACVLDHPRIDSTYLTQQADQMMVDVCRPLVVTAVAARDQGFPSLANSYVKLISELPLPLELRARILEEYFGPWLQTVRATIESLAEVEPLEQERVEDINTLCMRIADSGGADICQHTLRGQFDELLLVLRAKIKHAFSVFGSADNIYFQESTHYIGLWNETNDFSHLRQIAQVISTHWQNIPTLRAARDESLRKLQTIREVIGNTTVLAPAFPGMAHKLNELSDDVSDKVKSVKKEYDSTEGHIRRNATGMCEQLDMPVNRPPAEPHTPSPPPVSSGEFAELEARANAGDREALLTLADYYRTGRYVHGVFIPQDKAKAAALTAQAE